MEHPLTVISFLPLHIQEQFGHVIMLTCVMLIIIGIGLVARRMNALVPSKGQFAVESLLRALYNMGDSVMGREGRPYMPLIFGVGFYVACGNLLGLVPGFTPPTMNMNSTAAPALCVFFCYQYIGFKKHGLHYINHFLGPMKPLAPLMLVIELIGHFARPLSLTMRLFGNVTGEEILIGLLFMLVPLLVPLPMYMLATFTGGLQAFVFMLLSMMYISGALEEAH